jgi:citrate lyase subunit beta / citryl-CoA lyase
MSNGFHLRGGAATARSLLFVPGTRPERFAKALASGAHAVIVDFEDAVPLNEKDAARAATAAWLTAASPVLVRVNAAGTRWFDDDLALCAHPGVAGVVLPKAEDAAVVERVCDAIGDSTPVLPLIETAQGLWNAVAIGRAKRVPRLLFGSIDFQLDLNIRDDELLHYRSQLVLASRVAGIAAPIDGVTTAVDDAEAIRGDTLRAIALGFGGKLCIHPKQVAVVNGAFLPTAPEIEWARRVVAADAASGGAAVAVDGKMVDRPVLLKAQAILAEIVASGADH